MNTKAQTIFFKFMLVIILLILALAFAFPVQEQVDITRNNTYNITVTGELPNGTVGEGNRTVLGMDCDNESISNFQKGGCLAADLGGFYFIAGLIFLAGAIIAAKVLL